MRIFDTDRWEEIWATITKNKWRSFFTAMGVFWGIFMLTIMMGASGGLENMVFNEAEGFNLNSSYIWSRTTSIPYKGFRTGRWWDIQNGDIEVIRNNVDGLETIVGTCYGRSVNVVHGDKKGEYFTIGYMPQYQDVEPQILLYGRYINEVDMTEQRKVCMIGGQVYEELFNPGEDPVGRIIQVGSSYFTIIGVNEPMNEMNMNSNPRTTLIIPFTTMQQMYNRGDRVDELTVAAKKNANITDVEKEIFDILRSRHTISPDDTKAIGSFNLKERTSLFDNLFTGIRLLTWIVGIGTLLAGIIGISNIMLVVVRERTQEIGVRRALGAKPSSIISQIMSESFILTFIAGIVGLTLGVAVLSGADAILAAQASASGSTPISAQISFGLGMASLGILMLGGLLAGIIPAARAMSISPVDAIREE